MWKDIKDYDGLYQVNEKGEVRSLKLWNGHELVDRKKPLILKQSNTTTGYKKVELRKNKVIKSIKVHRLVAYAFIDNPNNKPFINHIDGNKTNNNVENLEWCTPKENSEHAIKTGLKHLNYASKEELIKYREQGLTINQIIKKTHIARHRLIKLFDEYCIPHHSKYNIDKDELKEMIKSGKRNTEIANFYNCPENLIARRRYQMKKGEY